MNYDVAVQVSTIINDCLNRSISNIKGTRDITEEESWIIERWASPV